MALVLSEERILDNASRYGKMDYSEWPRVHSFVLANLDHIVHNEFPSVRIPVPARHPISPAFTRNGNEIAPGPITPTQSPKVIPATPQNPNAATTNLNVTPNDQSTSPSVIPNSQPLAPNESSSSSDNAPTTSQTAGDVSVELPAGTLPPPVLALYNGILSMLNGPFSKVPPYTFQRLAELVLYPRSHYATLPAWLRALDKVLSVASTADVYPLPVPPDAKTPDGQSYLSQSNGTNAGPSRVRDDCFNGAELTRIPWIVESAEGEGDIDAQGEREDGLMNGVGGIEQPDRMLLSEAEDRARQARISPGANVADKDKDSTSTVTVNGLGGGSVATGGTGPGVPSDTVAMQPNASEREVIAGERHGHGDDDEMATARGPQEIGNEDIGPQSGEGRGMPGIVDLEAAVGRPGEGEIVPGSNAQVPEERKAASEEAKDASAEEGTEMAVDEAEKKDD